MTENNSFKTAISRFKPSAPFKEMEKVEDFQGQRILDYGCGKGFDADHLSNLGHEVEKFDPHFFPEKPRGRFDIIYNFYVLNVLDNEDKRLELLRDMKKRLTEDGSIYLAVRADFHGVKGVPFNDGIITQKGTFQKLWKKSEDLFSIISEAGLKVELTKKTSSMLFYKLGRK